MSEWDLIIVGVTQWAIGFVTAALYFEARKTRAVLTLECERDALWDELHGLGNPRVPSGAALDCVVGGCRWGTPSRGRCECATLTSDRHVCGSDIGEGDECCLDAGHEGAHS